MKRQAHILLPLLLSFTLLSGCKAWRSMKTFTKCQFRMTTLEGANLAGINVQAKKSITDLNLKDAALLGRAFATGSFPLRFTLNTEVRNPNKIEAAMNRLEWIILIDGIEMVRGAVNRRVVVPPNGGVSRIPLSIMTDLRKVLNKESRKAILNFGFNLVGAGNRPSRVTLKLKPAMRIGKWDVPYPGFFNVSKEFGSGSGT